VPLMRIGAIVLENVDAVILGDSHCDEVLLGMSSLRRLQLILRADTLILRRVGSKRGRIGRRLKR
jgi:predicted aspartyl protease